MVTVLGLDRLTDLTRFEFKGGIFEFADHDTAAEPAQGSSGIQIVFGRQGVPFFSGFEFRKDLFGSLFGFDQDMACIDLFGFKNTILYCFIEQLIFHDGVLCEILQIAEGDLSVIAICQDCIGVLFKFRVFIFIIIGDCRINVKGVHAQNTGFLFARVFIAEHGLQTGINFVFTDFNAGFFGFTIQDDIVSQFLDRGVAQIGFPVFTEDGPGLCVQGIKRKTVHLVHLSVLIVLIQILIAAESDGFDKILKRDAFSVDCGGKFLFGLFRSSFGFGLCRCFCCGFFRRSFFGDRFFSGFGRLFRYGSFRGGFFNCRFFSGFGRLFRYGSFRGSFFNCRFFGGFGRLFSHGFFRGNFFGDRFFCSFVRLFRHGFFRGNFFDSRFFGGFCDDRFKGRFHRDEIHPNVLIRLNVVRFAEADRPFVVKCILGSRQGIAFQRADFLSVAGNDVIAVSGLYRFTDLPRFKGKCGVFKFADHHAPAEPAQGAAVVFIGSVQGVFAREFIPFFSGFEFREDLFCGLFIFDENMACIDLFGFKYTAVHFFLEHGVIQKDMSGVIFYVIKGD